MRFLQAGDQQLVALEPERQMIKNLAAQAGYECEIQEDERHLILKVKPASKGDPMLLFDAGDPANLGWFARCQFYVDAISGAVLQTPLTLANCRDREGRPLHILRIALSKELPASFRLPGRQSISEQVVYALLYNLLVALKESGVAICGKGGIVPLAGSGRTPQTKK